MIRYVTQINLFKHFSRLVRNIFSRDLCTVFQKIRIPHIYGIFDVPSKVRSRKSRKLLAKCLEKVSRNFRVKKVSRNFRVKKVSRNFRVEKVSRNFRVEKVSRNFRVKKVSRNFRVKKVSQNFRVKKVSRNFRVEKVSGKSVS